MKSSILHIINLFIILFIVSCKKESTKTAKLILQKKDSVQQIETIITGKSDDPKAFKYLNFFYLDVPKKNLKSENFKVLNHPDSIFLKTENLLESQYIEILAFGTKKVYELPIFISPGDSINIIIKNGNISVDGTNKNHYKFYKKMYLNEYPIFRNDLLQYKNKCWKVFQKRDSLFEDFILKNPEVSKDFIEKTRTRILFEYYSRILHLTIDKSGRAKELDASHFEQVSKRYGIETSLKFSESYFGNLSFQFLNDPKVLKAKNYLGILRSYVHLSQNLTDSYSPSQFLIEKKIYLNEFSNKAQEGGLANTILKYIEVSPFRNSSNIKEAIKEFKVLFPNSNYLIKIDEAAKNIDLLNKLPPKEVLDEKLITLRGDTITFSDILAKTGKKNRVIDFWASWCGPCIYDIKNGGKNKALFAKDHFLDWVYISIDTDSKKWKQKALELKEFGTLNNQYLLLNPIKSQLKRKFELNSIPRYIIFDKNGYLVNDKAPKPTEYNSFTGALNDINNN
ncbi:hypothetical protein FDT66_01645 [Polaribacter aestuariivivens]|uniref:Thioredoxin domain-containing protein n=1 Tax=Polaribacter aestuariivivens TaxID=2304626 RepID=A0A5S3NCF6_9FLAO|nr:thioredoxin-like domain-containing protein [Polaribacter aestuariivivens]TMM32194.1 hypothetical protein FDT66_01645 [Polaribacter aestuariivivens]